MRYLPTSRLTPGMALGQDIYDGAGRLLLGRHILLTEEQISNLEFLGFPGVYVDDEFSRGIEIQQIVSPEVRRQALKIVYDLFHTDMRKQEPSEAEFKLRKTVESVVDDVICNGDIMCNIMDIKSYDDYIYYHSIHVGILSVVVGARLGLPHDELCQLAAAALLHDIGKPSCFSLAEDGIGHFFGHSDQSTSMAESILSRLRFDNASKEQIVRLVRYHDMPITADRKPIKRLLSKHGEDATRQLIELHKADTLGQSAICRHRIAIFEEVSQMINEILQEESCFTLKDLAVNGHDMMTLGFQGPTIGRVLQECLDAVLDEQIPNEHETLMAFAKDRQLKS